MPGAVLELTFTPAPRAQIAVWLEHADGRFIRTLALTESVAFRGIGNRPGASQMNSGYRWPYGRREGALPIWASRRAAAPGVQHFKRVIFQKRVAEGLASRTAADHSRDDYFCLSFDRNTTRRDALDAVSCASVFTSDKGRFIGETDVAEGYAEPWQDPVSGVGSNAPLPLHSLYPPRMDVARCADAGCYDHADVAEYAAHARSVMPEIDAVTMATPPGYTQQSLLFSLPRQWPKGQYALWIEVNVEGDYNDTFSATTFPTPRQPSRGWDSWAIDYGYAYRGQPSIAFAVPFELDEQGDASYATAEPVGRASWNFWADDFGTLEPLTGITDDPFGAPGSGADRLLLGDGDDDDDGQRVALSVSTFGELPEPDPDAPDDLPELMTPAPNVPAEPPDAPGSSSEPAPPDSDPTPASAPGAEPGGGGTPMQPDPGGAVIIVTRGAEIDGPVGPVRELGLGLHPHELHSHEWVALSFVAAESERPLHRYEVRVSTEPIVDLDSFIRDGRPAKTASVDPEGAVSLMLPVDGPAGARVEGELGNLVAETRYWVGVRAVDRLNRYGPISVAQITTTERTFATVTPCFVATAAYGTAMADDIRVLRRARDRHLMSHSFGRALVRLYYAHGAKLAAPLRASEALRAAARSLLAPVVAVAQRLTAAQ